MVLARLGLALLLLAAHAAGPDLACEELLDPVARAHAWVRDLGASLPGRTAVQETTIIRELPAGGEAARLFYLTNGPFLLHLEKIEVQKEFKGQGFSKLLIAEALVRQPLTRRIEAQLAWDNAAAFFDAFHALSFGVKLFRPAHANRLALEATPLYKVLRELGFTEVERVEVRGETIHVAISRAKAN